MPDPTRNLGQVTVPVWRYVHPDGIEEWSSDWEFGEPGQQLEGEDPKQVGMATIVPGSIQEAIPYV